MGRSRSNSASSGSSDDGKKYKDDHKKDKKDKKEKKDKKDKKDKKADKFEIPGVGKLPGPAGQLLGALTPALASLAGGHRDQSQSQPQQQHYQQPQQHFAPPSHGQPPLMPAHAYSPQPPQQHQAQQHAAYAPTALDPSHLPPHARLLNSHDPLPPPNEVGYAACTDVGGEPLFLVLVPVDGGLHPGKMVVRTGSTHGEVYVSYGGREIRHEGPNFALVAFDPQRMHWVPSPRGEVPHGVRPVDGGRERDGTPLYFALGLVNGGRVPGKAGRHLGGASVAFGGTEVGSEQAEVLCWI